jgi:hypothetical protein
MAEVLSQREQQESFVQACLDSAGWDLNFSMVEGMDTSSISESQRPAFEHDFNQCQVDAGIDLEAPARSPQDLAVEFSRHLDVFHCLEAQGVTGLAEPPTADAWIDAALSGGPDIWVPYADPALDTVGYRTWVDLQAQCPQDS